MYRDSYLITKDETPENDAGYKTVDNPAWER